MAFLERRLAADPTNWWAPCEPDREDPSHADFDDELRAATGLREAGEPTPEDAPPSGSASAACGPRGALAPALRR